MSAERAERELDELQEELTPKKSQEEETSEGEEGPSSTEIHLHRAGTININMPEPSTASRRLAGRWGDGGHVGQGSADQEYQELRSELTRLGNGGHGAESPPAALPPACGPPSPLAGSLHPGPAPTRASYGPAGLRRDDLEERATATIHASVADDPYAAGGSPRHYSSTSRVPAAAAGSPASGSNAVLSALRALQDKISRLQRERDSLSEQLEAARSSLDRERDDWARERGRLEATAKERTREQKLALEREATRRGEAEVTAAKQDERAQALERELSFVKERARRVEEEKQEASATADELREELAETRHELRSERERGDARLKSAKETEERASALAEERHRAYEETTLALQSERERREELEERQERTEAFLADVLELNEQLVRRSSRGKARKPAQGGGRGGPRKTRMRRAATARGRREKRGSASLAEAGSGAGKRSTRSGAAGAADGEGEEAEAGSSPLSRQRRDVQSRVERLRAQGMDVAFRDTAASARGRPTSRGGGAKSAGGRRVKGGSRQQQLSFANMGKPPFVLGTHAGESHSVIASMQTLLNSPPPKQRPSSAPSRAGEGEGGAEDDSAPPAGGDGQPAAAVGASRTMSEHTVPSSSAYRSVLQHGSPQRGGAGQERSGIEVAAGGGSVRPTTKAMIASLEREYEELNERYRELLDAAAKTAKEASSSDQVAINHALSDLIQAIERKGEQLSAMKELRARSRSPSRTRSPERRNREALELLRRVREMTRQAST